jgi:hypothetical protein
MQSAALQIPLFVGRRLGSNSGLVATSTLTVRRSNHSAGAWISSAIRLDLIHFYFCSLLDEVLYIGKELIIYPSCLFCFMFYELNCFQSFVSYISSHCTAGGKTRFFFKLSNVP